MRIGQGSDLHLLEEVYGEGSGLWLGGTLIACNLRAEAHSDGDVLLHACTDAILGSVAAGDIGRLFPDTAEENRNRKSSDFLTEALIIATSKGYSPLNIDTTIHLQQPKLAAHIPDIVNSLAHIMRLPTTAVNVKAKTGEKVGPIGEGLAISAEAVVLMSRQNFAATESNDIIT